MTSTCRKEGCPNPATPGQAYCCREHSPLGNYGLSATNLLRSESNARRPREVDPKSMTQGQLAYAMHVTVGAVYHWLRKGLIPFDPGDGSPRSKRFDLEACKRAIEVYRAEKGMLSEPSETFPDEGEPAAEEPDPTEDDEETEMEQTPEVAGEIPQPDPIKDRSALPLEAIRRRIQIAVPEPHPDEGEPARDAPQITDVDFEIARRLVSRAQVVKDRGSTDVELELLWIAVREIGLIEDQV